MLTHRATNLWAKKRNSNGEQLWLPLIVHMIDTKNTINFLYNNWLCDGAKELLVKDFDSENELQKFINFLGYIHDIGKATPAFQKKESYDRDRELDDKLIDKLEKSGFKGLKNSYLSDPNKSPHTIAGEAILEYFQISEPIGAIISAHHGKPLSKIDNPSKQLKTRTSNYWQDDNDYEIQKVWRDVQEELLNYGLSEVGYNDVSELPQQISQPASVLIEGLLIMADWLSSSEQLGGQDEIPLYPLIPIDQNFSNININDRYQRAMSNWSIDGEWIPEEIDDVNEIYQKYWGFTPRSVQKRISEEVTNLDNPGIVIVEAPMGIGKTEAALTVAQQLAYKAGRNGIYVGLPTQATTNAMFNRVNEWLGKIAENQSDNMSIKLMHGKSQFNKTYHNLPKADNVDGLGAVTINAWFSGKKSILTNFTVGTIDNLLLMGLKQKHLFLRHLGFDNKVVIIDEVHAYDTYMDSYLYKAIEWLGAYHVPLVVLSATIPAEKRSDLIRHYLKGKYGKGYAKLVNGPVGWEKSDKYPLLTMTDDSEVNQISDFDKQIGNKVFVKRIDVMDDELVELVLTKIEQGGVAGIIVNTIKRAEVLAKILSKTGVDLLVLHSAFLAPDRSRLEDELQNKIGKHAHRPKKLVVIGTQVLEQSLDIDFDVLFTDIAPIDLVLQRIGRLHRHDIKRPNNLNQPEAYIMGISQDGYGDANEAIYSKYLLMKTDYFMPDQITLPDDISPLVQKVYDLANDELVDGIEKERIAFDKIREESMKKAEVFQINSPKYPKRRPATIKSWLDKAHSDVSNDEQHAAAAVRDIKETIEVILLQKTNSEIKLLDGRLLSDVSSEEIAQQVIRLPYAITIDLDKSIESLETFTYKHFYDWQKDVWLKGSLALVLDQNLQTEFNGYVLKYDKTYGLSYEHEDKNG